MRYIVVMALVAGLCGQAAAQSKSKKPQPPRPMPKFLSFSDGSLDGSTTYLIDGVLKLTFLGSQVTGASIDVCYPTSPLSRRVDRLAIPLQVDGASVSGAGVSSAGSQATVSIKRTGSKDSQDLNGVLKVPGHTIGISATGLEFSEEDPAAPPPDSTAAEASEDESDKPVVDPSALSVTTKLSNVVDLVKLARSEGARVDPASLIPGCVDLRSGSSSISIDVDPSRSTAFLGKVKNLAGVSAAEFRQVADKTQLVRVKAKPSDADLIAALGRAMQKAIPDASIVSSGKDAGRDEIRLSVTRKVPYLSALGAQEALSLRATTWQDTQDKSISYVQIRSLDAKLVDSGKEQVFSRGRIDPEGEEDVATSDLDTSAAQQATTAALASDLHGEAWTDNAWVSK
ncbi:hypothetical protein [Methylobacterium sp. WL7]|uniref:hypothetical protein n=1 Tax=Methylobacterium sp. WL7 TaxID=2603900 RepID=UPI0011C8778B|nr:hypothetical protein [Methylobacterium sp. WL7]TXN42919.1 hypothetical protein FV233_20685 [Methylobacterium sp. WL7]